MGMIMNRDTLQLYKFGSELGGITHWPAQYWLCCMLHTKLSESKQAPDDNQLQLGHHHAYHKIILLQLH